MRVMLGHGGRSVRAITRTHPKVAQERLGHSTITTTMDLYSHVVPGMQEGAAARLDRAFAIAKKARGDH